ncbi:DUF397 domain-containing protein [Streptomyces sp. NBC_00178]|uniref:DUF397 domain-containing protein n=1 Tax=Streptomyces sp. NBC_00178 TaxID=2975672 RepID=UPI002E287855|nr:DUF397 domain-containing protein [Streptomyces sp. NBC_00178]
MSLRSSGKASAPEWFKSSYSGSDNNDCVEVARSSEAVRVRDSKDVPGPEIGVGAQAWSRFVAYAAR